MGNVNYVDGITNPQQMEKSKQELVSMVYDADNITQLVTKLRDIYGGKAMKKAIANTFGDK